MERIQSKKYKIGTYDVNKISLSCFDDKWYILSDGITALAYFRILKLCWQFTYLAKLIVEKI